MKQGSKRNKGDGPLRRSFALSARLVREASEAGKREGIDNLNRLVTVALQEYVRRHRREEFERQMDRMGADCSIREAAEEIQREFSAVEANGLPDD